VSDWFKCVCGRVLALDEQHECPGAPVKRRTRAPGSSADSVRAYRERTGNAYGKAYAKAKAEAVKALCAAHPEEFAALLEKARIDVGLGPTRA
jgi:hypothetical protein